MLCILVCIFLRHLVGIQTTATIILASCTCPNKTHILVELEVMLMLRQLLQVLEAHSPTIDQLAGDAISRLHAEPSIQDSTK